MKEIRVLALGIILGGLIIYLIIDKNELPSSQVRTVKKIDKTCNKNGTEVISYLKKAHINTKEKNYVTSKSNIENTQSVKTPDELYEEQYSQTENNDYNEENIIDRDVMPIELTQAEDSPEVLAMIDETIMPKTLQKAEEEESDNHRSSDDINDIPPLEPMEDEVLKENKPAISEEMIELEEYEEDSFFEDEIPL